ncbi:dTDP-4-dehydrorhamnose reductase [Odoribacter lunatus]|uniref:dTDP-4-dehydrorhamnose reductase n=1 Tax=Odoribacter lunatus TaxID=2941335 RepID=UPI00203AAB72|nr:dTDP-4-dehydrorhamnose reductase [Odoribacter lunatus]
MNILVTGAGGQLGSELRKIGFSPLDEVFFTDVAELDITDRKAVENYVSRNEIDTIVNCAAYTAVDKAEEEPEKAELVNVKAVENLAEVAEKEGCLLVHVSTDYVFDGTASEPYTEKSPVNPQTVYGRTKLAGERAIRKSGCLAIIVRTAWLYSEFGGNFMKTMLRLAGEKGELHVVCDQVGTPTYAADLAAAIVHMLADESVADKTGIYHFSNEGICSWCDFAREIMRLSGNKCTVNGITTAEYPAKAHRPAYSVLDKTKIKQTFGVAVPEWREALERMMRTRDEV